jgi:hypothetical protein
MSLPQVGNNKNIDEIDMINNDNIYSNKIIYFSLKNVKYYKSLYNLIFLYTNELNNIISDINVITHINNEINQELIKKILKKIEKYTHPKNGINFKILLTLSSNEKHSTKIKEILKLLKLLKLLIKLYEIANYNIQIINEINIYDTKILLSDTSKNNISKNKMHILDIYNNFATHLNTNNTTIIDEINIIIKNIVLAEDVSSIENVANTINTVNNYFNKHVELIDFIVLFIRSLNDSSDFINDILFIINENNKQLLLVNELEKHNVKSNTNFQLTLNNNTTLINKTHILKNNTSISNIVKTFNKFKFIEQFDSLEKLLSKINIKIKISNKIKGVTNLNKESLDDLNKATKLYENEYKQKLTIILLECKSDDITYDINNLLNKSLVIDKLSGINDSYVKKTNTILESKNVDPNSKNIYISNIQKTYIINPLFDFSKSEKINIQYKTYDSKIILIHTNDNKSFNILSNTNSNFIEFNDIFPLIRNQPNYNIENYNSLLEINILNKIENKNILDDYYKSIKFDIHSYDLKNTLEIKNNIINDIGTKIKLDFNYENKNIIIDEILNIIINNISKYIKNKNKIDYDAETYMTYLANVNSLIGKFKKEIVDNYDNNFIDNIDTIIENIYSKILKINDNIVDKYYYSHLVDN